MGNSHRPLRQDGKAVRRLRQRTGQKLGEFSENCGVSYQTLANLESEQQNVSFEILYRIADGLGCSIEAVLSAAGREELLPHANGDAA